MIPFPCEMHSQEHDLLVSVTLREDNCASHESSPICYMYKVLLLPIHDILQYKLGGVCGEPSDSRVHIPTFCNTTCAASPQHQTRNNMQRLVPQRARQLWGHAPRVRSFNRRRRTFATVSGTSQYENRIAALPRPHMSDISTDPTM
jgi:hypothetical protein